MDVPITDPTSMSAALEASGAFLTGFCRPDEARALASQAALRAGFLSPAEESHYLSLRCEKRRLDWLAGRAAAKRALRRYFRETAGSEPELAALEIASDAQGAPFCAAPAAPSFSISHCAAGGLCAVGLSGRRVGADWEMVAPRSRELARIFACPGELSPDQDDPRGQTRLWAVKEAVLKLLGLGLAASPREIQTQPWLDLAGRARERWLELGSPTLLPAMAQTDDSVVAVVHTQPRS